MSEVVGERRMLKRHIAARISTQCVQNGARKTSNGEKDNGEYCCKGYEIVEIYMSRGRGEMLELSCWDLICSSTAVS